MSLTQADLQEIRSIVQDVVSSAIQPLESEVLALRNDVKEIYAMLSELQSGTVTDKNFRKLNVEEKLLKINAELIAAAKQAGVTLPR